MPVAAAIPAAAGMVGGLLQQRAQNKQKKEEAALWNQYLQKYGQAQQQALGGLAAQDFRRHVVQRPRNLPRRAQRAGRACHFR